MCQLCCIYSRFSSFTKILTVSYICFYGDTEVVVDNADIFKVGFKLCVCCIPVVG